MNNATSICRRFPRCYCSAIGFLLSGESGRLSNAAQAAGLAQPISTNTSLAATRARSDAELLSAWLKSKTDGGSEHTARLYSRVGEAFLKALGCPLREAVVEDVQAAVEKLRIKEDGKPASAATVATHLAVAKSFLRFAHRVGYTRFNAGELLKVKKIHGARAQRIMQPIDVQLLLRCAGSPRNRLLLAIAYYGALRVSELASLTWGHFVEREGGRVQIAGLVGKGDKEREVLLPASVAVLIRQARGKIDSTKDDAPVFVSRQGTQLSERMINHVVKAAAKTVQRRLAPLAAPRARITCARQWGSHPTGQSNPWTWFDHHNEHLRPCAPE